MKKIYTFLITAFFMIVTVNIACTQSAILDSTFGTAGKVTTAIGSGDDIGKSAALQSDGKIVVAGYSHNGTDNDFAVVRYNTNGSLDSTFSSDGIVTTAIGSGDDLAWAMAIQADGKIVVAGRADINGTDHFALARYNSNGSPDNTFSSDGKLTTAVGSSSSYGLAVAIQADGKIIVGGNAQPASAQGALVRYNSDGSLDNTFSFDGIATAPVGGYNGVIIQNDGKIVAVGETYDGFRTDFSICRINSNGSLDSTFSSDGIVIQDVSGSYDGAFSAAIQPDGKIVVGGYGVSGTQGEFALIRLNTDGSQDFAFGANGLASAGDSYTDKGASVVIQPDGKIILGGRGDNPARSDFAVARFNNDGTLDSAFCSVGILKTEFASYDDGANTVLLQADGKIVLAGFSGQGPSSSLIDFAVARYSYSAPTGIGTVSESAMRINIYPNPATTQLTINLGGMQAELVSIYNVDGKLVNEIKLPANNTIGISGLTKGVYVAEVKVGDAMQRVRWVKM